MGEKGIRPGGRGEDGATSLKLVTMARSMKRSVKEMWGLASDILLPWAGQGGGEGEKPCGRQSTRGMDLVRGGEGQIWPSVAAASPSPACWPCCSALRNATPSNICRSASSASSSRCRWWWCYCCRSSIASRPPWPCTAVRPPTNPSSPCSSIPPAKRHRRGERDGRANRLLCEDARR
jgi:hypothetical protein